MNIREGFVLSAWEAGAPDIDQQPEIVTTRGGYCCYDALPKFAYIRATTVDEALALLASHEGGVTLLAGGQELIRRLRDRCEKNSPRLLIDIKTIPDLGLIRETQEGLHIGSTVTLARLAQNERVAQVFPIVTSAAAHAGVAQYRNRATVGGDLCQEVRCWYFRASGDAFDCRRKCGSQCPALSGENSQHAILGSRDCVAVCPSALAPVLATLNTKVEIVGSEGSRTVPVEEFYAPMRHVLRDGEVVTGVFIPKPEAHAVTAFEAVSEGSLFDPVIASCAVNLSIDGGVCTSARIFLGGVAAGPWRARAAEELLLGHRIDAEAARSAEVAPKNGTGG